MTDADAAVPMTREYILRQALVWLEHERITSVGCRNGNGCHLHGHYKLAESLTDHLVNNALQLLVAKKETRIRDEAESLEDGRDLDMQYTIGKANAKNEAFLRDQQGRDR